MKNPTPPSVQVKAQAAGIDVLAHLIKVDEVPAVGVSGYWLDSRPAVADHECRIAGIIPTPKGNSQVYLMQWRKLDDSGRPAGDWFQTKTQYSFKQLDKHVFTMDSFQQLVVLLNR